MSHTSSARLPVAPRLVCRGLLAATLLGALASCASDRSAGPPEPVVTVTLSPPESSVLLDGKVTLSATLAGASGRMLTKRAVTWASENPAVATVAGGVVTSVDLGTTVITATSEGQVGSATVTVMPQPVATVTIAPVAQPLYTGQSVTLTATLRDAKGRVRPGTVAWASETPAVATIDEAGVVTALAAGPATISATSDGKVTRATLTIEVSAAAVRAYPTRVSLFTGARDRLFAEVLDANGAVLTGRPLTFRSSNAAVATVDAQGRISAVGTGTATIEVEREGKVQAVPVTVAAPAGGSFDIVVRFQGATPDPRLVAAVETAVARWERVIVGDLPDQPVNYTAGQCSFGAPAITETVDDLLILITLDSMGATGVLGYGGPCMLRQPYGQGLPAVGSVRLNRDKVELMLSQDLAVDVIAHEIGHVLGIGTLWNMYGIDGHLFVPDVSGDDPRYIAPVAREAAGVLGYLEDATRGVAVENQGGGGTAGAHWRETDYRRELMTGYVASGGRNPLSLVTVQSLADLGYTVEAAGADPFTALSAGMLPVEVFPSTRLAGPARSRRRGGPVDWGLRIDAQVMRPRFGVDRHGRVTPLGGGTPRP